MQTPLLKASHKIHEGFCSLYQDQLLFPNGHQQLYYKVATRPRAALVIATTPEGNFLLVREYRHAVEKVVIGLPGGFVEDHEEPVHAAERELFEETGYKASKVTAIGTSLPLPGLLAQQVFFFHAQNVQPINLPHLDPSECLETVVWSCSQLLKAIEKGASVDSALCAGLFFFQLQ